MRIFAALAAALLFSSSALTAQQRPASSVAKLPTVTANALDKAKLTLPADFSSPLNLLILSFARDQQAPVAGWLPVAQQAQSANPKLQTWVLPISAKEDILFKWWLNSSLRSGLPANQTRHSTVPLYVDKPQFLKSLAISSEKQIVVLVTDRSGLVLWSAEGSVTDGKKASLAAFLKTSPLTH